jgi:hypothetical protein
MRREAAKRQQLFPDFFANFAALLRCPAGLVVDNVSAGGLTARDPAKQSALKA